MPQETASPAVENEAPSSRLDRALPFIVGVLLVALAGVFWVGNGANVFMELVSAAWALCF